MKTFVAIAGLVLTGLFATHAAEFKIGAHNFTLPDGFEIELVAGTNLVPRPINASFDEQGRLYVTDSSGSNDNVRKQLADKPHRVVRLEDTDGDGKFDKQVVFADRMMFPEGALWLDGSLYVSAPPSIWKLTDTNSDGVADVREEWFKGQTLGGCANDLHGPYAGPDGWIYWCKGGFEKQTHTLGNGKTFTSRASHIWRARPDGSGLEPIMTGGMDNPVGLAWSPEGDLFLSGTFFQHPAGGKRDGIIHVLYGGVYGKDHDVLDGHPRTGDLLPMMTHLGPAAPSGMIRYKSRAMQFGDEVRTANNLFVACFNLHKVVRCALTLNSTGATHATRDEDFLVSDNTDFHPTDILEDADGSLLVVDTGGWYKLCCPTSQLYKPDVLGGIYRIRQTGQRYARKQALGEDLNWSTMPTAKVADYLGFNLHVAAERAADELVKRGDEAVRVLDERLSNPNAWKSPRTIWALHRIPGSAARAAIRKVLDDPKHPRQLVVPAIHSVTLWRDTNAMPQLLRLVQLPFTYSPAPKETYGNPEVPSIRIAAAEAIGQLGDRGAVYALLAAASASEHLPGHPVKNDRLIEHSLIYAMIQIGDVDTLREGLAWNDPYTQRAVLLALEQLPGGKLAGSNVVALLKSKNRDLREAAWWVSNRHPDWSSELKTFFEESIRTPNLAQDQTTDLIARLAAFAGNPEIQALLADSASHGTEAVTRSETAFRAMVQARLKRVPDSWVKVWKSALTDHQGIKWLAASTAKQLALTKEQREILKPAILQAAASDSLSSEHRADALAALPGIELRPEDFNLLRSELHSKSSTAARLTAADTLSKARLTSGQLSILANSVKSVGPLEMNHLLPAFARATNEDIGFALVASLEKSKSLAALRAETLKPRLTNFPASVQQKAEALLATLNTDAAQQKQHIDTLLVSVKGGDIRRGQALFNSAKTACSACHAIGYLGGNVGPDLTRIGQIRNERDLLEAIVYPSASFVRSYEPMIVATKSGDEFSGVLRKDSSDEVVLATGPNTEQRIARADIADQRPGAVSVMPGGLAEQLTKEELADLLAFLRATRW